jgi:hypothetical protein
MDTKLTLSLDKAVIEKAKTYAENQQISLSRLIESYLSTLTTSTNEDVKITPLVESLSGVIELSDDFDSRKDYSDYLMDKYK